VLCASTTVQSGTSSGFEACYGNEVRNVGERIVVARKAGAQARALRIDTHSGRLTIATAGASFGHNAAATAQTTAAVYWNSARTGTKPFVGGAANPTNSFSSDGPRKLFFAPSGAPITPGNFLFGTNGGAVLNKPDFAAADGAFSKTPGFRPFFGTSAAAPHAAAIAALVKSARPDYTAVQVLAAMKASALDIRAPGVDRDSGVGIVMAWEAVQYALTH
jgi:subtilisin family serine protease